MLANQKKRATWEHIMKIQAFRQPVFMRDASLEVREIDGVVTALAFLADWPQGRRGPIYQSAFRACSAAHGGQLHVEGARDALRVFGRSAGILEQSPVPMEPWVIAATKKRGGVSA